MSTQFSPARLAILICLAALAVLVLAACGSRDQSARTTPTPPGDDRPAQAAAPDTSGWRVAPLAVGADFHNDPASIVSATGRPQLIEFFTFW